VNDDLQAIRPWPIVSTLYYAYIAYVCGLPVDEKQIEGTKRNGLPLLVLVRTIFFV
jgi:hypothetical protein